LKVLRLASLTRHFHSKPPAALRGQYSHRVL
jgi:hypothetical protein